MEDTTLGNVSKGVFMLDTIRIGMLGFGTVGKGVYKILKNNAESIAVKVGAKLEIVKVLVKNLDKDRGVDLSPEVFTQDVHDILDNPLIDIVVEVMGGIHPALEYALQTMQNGKSVITANKDMIADVYKRQASFGITKEFNKFRSNVYKVTAL